jgi:glycosyltransferase involved in cell wall biosynthesis
MLREVAEIVFWLSVFLVFWTYVGYYLLLKLLSVLVVRETERVDITPGVSIVITAYNEQKKISRKLEECLSLDYPKDQLEIIVASDGSTDGTNSIVQSFETMGVQLIAVPERRGKHYAQEQAIGTARHGIIVLTDATTSLRSDSIRKIVRSFADQSIGCVSGMDVVASSTEAPQGEGVYVRYEMSLRSLESRVCSLIGVSGSFFAVRKELCNTWFADMSSDFFVPIVSYMNGKRAILDSEAIGEYELVKNPEREFHRKVRTVVHGLAVLIRLASVMNPFRYGLFSFQMISHKLLRWLVPFLLILMLATNLLLLSSGLIYVLLLFAQASFCIAALAAYLFKFLERNAVFKIPFFFVMVNLSILVAWIRYLTGERYVTWERTDR